MLVNRNNDNNHVKFISYDGKYPCLCMGTLILEIDGTKYSFGNKGNFLNFGQVVALVDSQVIGKPM